MSRGNPVQGQPQLHLSSSVAPPTITNYNSTKNATGPNQQNNFMQFSMNTITSPYAHGLVQKQISLQNQNSGAKSSHKEIQLIQAY